MKTKMEWDIGMSVCNVGIDNDHKILIDILNRAITLYNEDINHPNLFKVIFHLMHYTCYHFKKEEHFFVNNETAIVKNHLNEHEEFKAKVQEMSQLIQNKNNVLVDYLELIVYLEIWLHHHIKESDHLLMVHGIIPVNQC